MISARQFVVLAAFSLVACGQVPPQTNLPAPYSQHGVKVIVDGLWKDIDGNVRGVSGVATNETSGNLLTCIINLDVLDASGVK